VLIKLFLISSLSELIVKHRLSLGVFELSLKGLALFHLFDLGTLDLKLFYISGEFLLLGFLLLYQQIKG
jgi:hypothetical protein